MQSDSKNYDIKACLKDIEQSIQEIYEFLPAKRDFFEFRKDLKTRKAIEGALLITTKKTAHY